MPPQTDLADCHGNLSGKRICFAVERGFTQLRPSIAFRLDQPFQDGIDSRCKLRLKLFFKLILKTFFNWEVNGEHFALGRLLARETLPHHGK